MTVTHDGGVDEWTAAFDALEALLDVTRAALAAGEPTPTLFEAPAPSCPLPDSLAARAHTLLVQTDELAELVAVELAGVRDELRRVPPGVVARPQTGRRVDVGA